MGAGCSLHIQSCHLLSTLSCHFLSCTFMLIAGAPPLRARHSHFTCALCHGLGRLPPDSAARLSDKRKSRSSSRPVLHSTAYALRIRLGFLVILLAVICIEEAVGDSVWRVVLSCVFRLVGKFRVWQAWRFHMVRSSCSEENSGSQFGRRAICN